MSAFERKGRLQGADRGVREAMERRREDAARGFMQRGGVAQWPAEARHAVVAWAQAEERRGYRWLPGGRHMLCGGERHYHHAMACLEAAGMHRSPEVAAVMAAERADVTPGQAVAFAAALRDQVPTGEPIGPEAPRRRRRAPIAKRGDPRRLGRRDLPSQALSAPPHHPVVEDDGLPF